MQPITSQYSIMVITGAEIFGIPKFQLIIYLSLLPDSYTCEWNVYGNFIF